jgi:Flp pilus assembly protein TadG
MQSRFSNSFGVKRASQRGQGRRGFAAIMTALLIGALIPIVGLSVDMGVLYLVKTRLSMAVDSGALAGARALNRGNNDNEQIAAARATARNYVRFNFPANFLANTNLRVPDPSIDLSVANTRSVTVSATVTSPLYFLRVFGTNSREVSASATAVRLDVNVAVVLDRSSSLEMSGSCDAVKENAINFVNRFAEGRDNVGLVTFATSSRPDFPIASNFHTANPSVVNTIGNITCNGTTNSAQGLWQGYAQLAGLNEPNALNVILFFTDGQPTAFTGDFAIKPTSTCADKNPKRGAIAGLGSAFGLLDHAALPQPLTSDMRIAPNSNGCAYAASWPYNSNRVGIDIVGLPATDAHGNSLSVPSAVTSSNIEAAAVNAADSAALRIRTGAVVPGVGSIRNVIIYSIGLGNAAGGVEQDFLRRVSNDPAASNYDSTRPAGLFVYAPQASDLTQAFNRIASEILRMSR